MKIHKVILLLLAVTLAAGLAASPALAGDTGRELCEGAGGIWLGIPDDGTGNCYWAVNDPISLANCTVPEYRVQFYSADVLQNTKCDLYLPQDGVSTLRECSILGGTWDDSGDPWTCTVSHTLFGDCSGTTIYSYTVPGGFYLSHSCTGGSDGGGGSGIANPGYGKFGGKIQNDAAGSAHLGGNKNGSLYYNAGTCASGCIFSPNLPAGAAGSLPSDAIATLYVRIADGSDGSYNVCFDAGELTSPVVYRYVGGAWVAQPVFFSGGQVCVTASGDGAFALGGS